MLALSFYFCTAAPVVSEFESSNSDGNRSMDGTTSQTGNMDMGKGLIVLNNVHSIQL